MQQGHARPLTDSYLMYLLSFRFVKPEFGMNGMERGEEGKF